MEQEADEIDFPVTWVKLRPLKDRDGIPASVRMRRLLKAMLRGYGVRVDRLTVLAPGCVTDNDDRVPVGGDEVKETLLWFDGACEPTNPGGLATYGFLVREDEPPATGRFIHSDSGVVGKGDGMTNNLAEYTALERGLRWLIEAGRADFPVVIRGDSQLVVNQVLGQWQCKAENLRPLLFRCLDLLELFPTKEIRWVPREQNEGADELTRAAWESAAGRPFPERPTKRRRPGWQ